MTVAAHRRAVDERRQAFTKRLSGIRLTKPCTRGAQIQAYAAFARNSTVRIQRDPTNLDHVAYAVVGLGIAGWLLTLFFG